METAPIGIFDSGIGGLTVAREIARALPSESLVYFGDTARCPYGPQDLQDVQRYVVEIGAWLESRKVKLIVIACNTATAAGLELAQRAFDVPVIGVVEPGARAAVMATRNRRIGVIGTVGTIESGTYSRAIRMLDAGVTVYSAAAPRFVDIVEEGLRLDSGAVEGLLAASADVFVRPTFHQIARDYLDPLKRSGIDTLVLGCTHFPLLAAAIGQVMGPRVQLISSAEETAREVAEALTRRGQLAARGVQPRYEFTTTGEVTEFVRLATRVFGARPDAVGSVSLAELAGVPAERHIAALDARADEGVSDVPGPSGVAACD